MNEIVLVTYSVRPGGLEATLSELIEKMPGYIFSVFLLRPLDPGAPNVLDNKGVMIKEGSDNNILLFIKYFIFGRQNREKIFHHFNSGPFILLLTRLAGVKKIIYSIHGTKYWNTFIKKIYLKIFWQIAVNKKVIFIANSHYSRKIFIDNVSGKSDPLVLWNSFDPRRFNYKKKEYPGNFKICYVGRLVKGKNLHTWIDVAGFLSNNCSAAFKFSIYGLGPLKDELQAYTTGKNLDDVIEFKGYTENPWNIYHENDLLMSLSEYESFGNVVVESILCGTPVIASDIPSHQEIFTDHPEFLVRLDENITRAVYSKISNYDILLKAVESAREEFANKFYATNLSEKYSRIYDSR